MGRGNRPAKAKNLLLVPSAGAGVEDVPDTAAAIAVVLDPPAMATSPPASMPAESETEAAAIPSAEPAPEPGLEVVEPTLAELQAVKEEIRTDHPAWYPEFRDNFGHQFNDQLVPQFVGLTAADLGLPAGTDADRVRREIRALAFARSYLLAQAGDVEGLRAVSRELLYFWDDRLGGKLVPAPTISPDNPAPWVQSINRLRSRNTGGMDSRYGDHSRFRRFLAAVKGWTDGRWMELRAASRRVLKGGEAKTGAEREACELLEAVRAAENDAPRLWRRESAASVAERMGVSRASLLTHLQARIGQEVTQDLVSTSSRENVWSGDFVWEVEPGAQAIHAYPISYHPSESEWITAGSFRLLAVEAIGHGGVKVRVAQTGVFKEE